jgi:pimeloyl-ACP methyl ester carboxylesterase
MMRGTLAAFSTLLLLAVGATPAARSEEPQTPLEVLARARDAWARERANEAIELLAAALARGGFAGEEARARRLLGQWLGARAGVAPLRERLNALVKTLDPQQDAAALSLIELATSYMTPVLAERIGKLVPSRVPEERAAALEVVNGVECELCCGPLPAGATPTSAVGLIHWIAGYRETHDANRRKLLRRELEREYPRLDLALLAQLLGQAPIARKPVAPGVTELAVTIQHDGSKTSCHLYVPSSYTPFRSWPLLVFMHGLGDSGHRAIGVWQALAEQQGWLIACPTATTYRNQGWGETDLERSTTLSAIDEVRRHVNVDPERIYLGGVSMGGHGAWSTAMHHADRFTALFVINGGPRIVRYRLLPNLRHVWVYDAQGALDDPRLISAVRYATQRLAGLSYSIQYAEDPIRGHEWLAEAPAAFANWVTPARRPRYPERVTLWTMGAPHERAYWLEARQVDKAATATPQLPTQVAAGQPEEVRRQRWIELLEQHVAQIEARIAGPNWIVIERCERANLLRLHLATALFDFDRPVKITYDGKVLFEGRVRPSLEYMLETTRHQHDAVYGTALDVRLR